MSPILIAATTIISLALVAYTIGVFGERNSGTLKRSHLIFFWIGLACDSTGTAIMSSMHRRACGHPRAARCRQHRAGNRFRHRYCARRTDSAQEEAGRFAVRRNGELAAVAGWRRRTGKAK